MLYMGRGRGRPGTTTFNFYRTSEDDDIQFLQDVRGRQFSSIMGRGRPGRGQERGRQISEIVATSEDEDGEDVDVLRRPAYIIQGESE